MDRRLWGKYGKLAGLLTDNATGSSCVGKSRIQYVFAEEDEIGIDRDGLKRLVAMAEEIKAKAHPIFVMDNYRALQPQPASKLKRAASYANPASTEESPGQDRPP